MLYCSASLAMSTKVLNALPGRLDIKTHSPSILYIPVHKAPPPNQLRGLQNFNVFVHTLSKVEFLSSFSFRITFSLLIMLKGV